MKKILLLLCLSISIQLTAQNKFNSKSFSININDLKINSYSKDSTANALVIYEYGNSYFDDETFNLKTEIKRKIKIFNKSESDYTTKEIGIYISDNRAKRTKIENLKASTYNLVDGNIIETKLSEDQIFEVKEDKNHSTLKFTLPNLQDGSVITYSYTIDTPFIYKYHNWAFQEDIPVLYSEYNTSIFGNYNYNLILVGEKKLDINESFVKKNCFKSQGITTASCLISKYVMTDIPAFKEEDYMTSKNNYISKLKYELKEIHQLDGTVDKITKTWKDTDKEWKTNNDFGRQILKTNLGKDLLSDDIKSISDPLEKAKAIYSYVQGNYVWNDKYRIFSDVSLKNLIKNKTGNVSEINILLNTLLNQNNIKSKPVILSTRSNGFITKLIPIQYDYNYMVVEANVNGKSYLLDATSPYLSFGMIPFKCLNSYGRRIDFKNGSDWVDIKPGIKTSSQHLIKLKIDQEKDLLLGSIKSKYFGYHAYPKRKKYFSNSNYLKNLKDKYQNFVIDSFNVATTSKSENTFNESFNFIQPELNTIDGKIYLDPFVIKHLKKNPFNLQERTYPVDFGYKDSFIYAFEIDLEGKYNVIEKPKDITVKLPNNEASCVFISNVVNDKLILSFRVLFNKSIYQPNQYESLKKLMNYVVDVQTKTLIVLEKK